MTMTPLERFEALVLSQQPADKPWTPVTDYSVEARTSIEGQHPALIRTTFFPKRVVDAGSGYGYLVAALRALGIEAHGFDTHPKGQWCQQKSLTNTDFRMSPESFDLVICREVLEHLTILQIRQAVTNLCKLSTRYAYVTTRFSKDQSHLLNVDTSDELDPTHITMLTQDFLRVLFVLEGFKRRADLEEKLDWMKKGRVLVYERV